MWACEKNHTVHAQRSYLTVAQLTFSEWRSAFPLDQNLMKFEKPL